MATIRTNPIVEGLSGMLGRTVVFRQLRGKTIMANCPSPARTQSEQQKTNRSKFRDASHWAHQVLLDPERKMYYQKKAKKLNLPNAYTAAITDYMRKSKLMKESANTNATTYEVAKKDFEIKSVKVVTPGANGAANKERIVSRNRYNEWTFDVSKDELIRGAFIYIKDDTNRETVFNL